MQHIVSISGGKDSTATYLMALEKLGGDFLPVFADTGNEHPLTLEYLSTLAQRTGGPEIISVRADFTERLKKRRESIVTKYPAERIAPAIEAIDLALETDSPFLSLCVWKGMFPSNTKRFCTSELKIIPIHDQVFTPYLDAGETVVSWQGIRADESLARSKAKEREEIDEGVIAYRPLLKWTVQDVFAMHRRHNIEPNPLYRMGMTRVGCMPCFMARKSEISAIARRCPEHVGKILFWERTVQQASKSGISTFFPCTKVPGYSDMRGNVKNVMQWATGINPCQCLLPFERLIPACQSEYGLCA